MFRGLLFLMFAIPYLIFQELRILMSHVFLGRRRTLQLLDREVIIWGNHVLRLMQMIQGVGIARHRPPEGTLPLPERFIVVSNHQSLLDILLLIGLFKGRRIRFVAKRSLGRGIPTISRTLVMQRHALIDRNSNFRTTLGSLKKLASRCGRTESSPTIFPEGTRSRNGEIGTFHAAGLKVLAETSPCPVVVCGIEGAWRLGGILDFLKAGRETTIHLGILGVLPCPEGKEALADALAQARSMITDAQRAWTSAEG